MVAVAVIGIING